MEEARISNRKVDISEDSVKSFFDKRGQNFSEKEKDIERYTLILFQDDNPELALARDKSEKDLINNLIEFRDGSEILDIGCGIGRWADNFRQSNIKQYIGIDFSNELIKIAKKIFREDNKFKFSQGSFQEVTEVLSENNYPNQYDYILVNGVFMYINDSDIEKCMKTLTTLLKTGGTLYLKDSVGIDTRFTLKNFDSKELKSAYNAIYRSLSEWDTLFDDYLPSTDYDMIKNDVLFKDEMKNRKETTDYYWIIRKK